ncbi:MAG TPA: CerR family C-terminal domain-containing protein [Syntrophorhabdaceae bacterium]|jgi:AcrR family transcriptional regulator
MKNRSTASSDTKTRILEAAGKVFSGRRFQDATVREICTDAGANVAAVNYHFGDKKRLYLATLKYWQRFAFEKYPMDRAADLSLSPEERLKVFILQFLRRVFDEGEASWFGRLMVRELVEPTEGLDMVVEEAARPTFEILAAIIRELLGKGASETTIRLCGASVIGQSVFFFVQQPLIKRLFSDETWDRSKTDVIAEHIARFSLTAMKAFASGKKKGDR